MIRTENNNELVFLPVLMALTSFSCLMVRLLFNNRNKSSMSMVLPLAMMLAVVVNFKNYFKLNDLPGLVCIRKYTRVFATWV